MHADVRLARPADAAAIAAMSRPYIEHGLSWRWQPSRVLRAIRDSATNVVVAEREGRLLGFGIMEYAESTAHLVLLAVDPLARHQGLGRRLVAWLEDVARAAGIEWIRVEARADNANALAFYRALGFDEFARVEGYYEGRIDAVRLQKPLVPPG